MSTATRKLVVEILGDAKGMKGATKEAEAAVESFGKRLGGVKDAMVGALAGGAMAAFGKQAVDAFTEDAAAADRLARTLTNVTGATSAQVAAVEDAIAAMERQFAVADDHLRPAFETLVRATKDVDQAQRMMTLALDVSAGTGRSLEEVALALVKAQNGQTKGLQGLGIELKNAEGKAVSFDEIMRQLSATFSGQAAAATETAAGKARALSIEYDNMQESIGAALLPVMQSLVGVASTLFGWWNSLDEGTQRIIVQLGFFGGAIFAAVKVVGGLEAALKGMLAAQTAATLGMSAAQLAVLGIGAAIAGTLLVWNALGTKKREVAARAKEVGAAIQTETERVLSLEGAVINLNTALDIFGASMLNSGEDGEKLGVALATLGISADEAAVTMLGLKENSTAALEEIIRGTGAFSGMESALARAVDSGESYSEVMAGLLENTGRSTLTLTADQVKLIKALEELDDQAEKTDVDKTLGEAMLGTAAAAGRAGEAALRLAEKQTGLKRTGEDVLPLYQEFIVQLQRTKNDAALTAGALADYEGVIRDTADTIRETKPATEAAAEGLALLFGTDAASSEWGRQVQADFNEVAGAGEEMERRLSEMWDRLMGKFDRQEFLLDVDQQLADLKKAGEEAFEAAAKGAKDAAEKQDAYNRKVIETQRFLAGYAAQIEGLPKEQQTKIAALLDQGSIDHAVAILKGLTMARTIQLFPSVRGKGTGGNGEKLVDGERATGGPVSAGGMYRVTERGLPELLNVGGEQYLMMAGQPGYVTPLTAAAPPATAAAGSGPTVIQLVLDGRVITEVVHDGLLAKQARGTTLGLR